MFIFSSVLLGCALVVGVIGYFEIAEFTWLQVSPVFYVLLLLPILLFATGALRKSFAPHTMIAFRAVMFIVVAAALIAFLL